MQLTYACKLSSPPLTANATVFITIPVSLVSVIWYRPASLAAVLFTVRLRQSSEKVYLGVLVQERLTVPLLPVNTHWIPSFVTAGTGSFTTVKEIVPGCPMLDIASIIIGLLFTPSGGDTTGGAAEENIPEHLKVCSMD